MKKSNYISIGAGLVGLCVGAVATAIFCKKAVEKEVKNAVDEIATRCGTKIYKTVKDEKRKDIKQK